MVKITIIGAGSYFTSGLIGDFFRVRDLWGSEVVLYDVNRHDLRIMGKIVSNYILSENVDLEVSYTTDLKDALENSDFVITTIRVGGTVATKYYRDSDEIWCTAGCRRYNWSKWIIKGFT